MSQVWIWNFGIPQSSALELDDMRGRACPQSLVSDTQPHPIASPLSPPTVSFTAPQAALCAHFILHIPLLSLQAHGKQLSISHSLGIGMCNKATWSTLGRKNVAKELYRLLQYAWGCVTRELWGSRHPGAEAVSSRWNHPLDPKGFSGAQGPRQGTPLSWPIGDTEFPCLCCHL